MDGEDFPEWEDHLEMDILQDHAHQIAHTLDERIIHGHHRATTVLGRLPLQRVPIAEHVDKDLQVSEPQHNAGSR